MPLEDELELQMTTFWLIRHGQTDWNLQNRIQGSTDIELNDTGLEQARQMAAELRGMVQPTVLYSSPQLRARQTAGIIAEALSLPVTLDDRLRERGLGTWEGMTMDEIRLTKAQEYAARQADPVHYRIERGETTLEVAERMLSFAQQAAKRHPQQDVVVVSHGYAISVLVCLLEGHALNDALQHIPENAHPLRLPYEGAPVTYHIREA